MRFGHIAAVSGTPAWDERDSEPVLIASLLRGSIVRGSRFWEEYLRLASGSKFSWLAGLDAMLERCE